MASNSDIITSTAALASFCESLAGEAFVALDTEFIREKTYYPQLCLLQMAGSKEARAVDPLAEGMDLAPLLELLANPRILKVFHAGRQDIEIFYHLNGKIPTPVFDTQIGAQFAGYGESISYSDFIKRTVNVHIDKASRFTDWARRPLTQRQLDYALSDVVHLREAYEVLARGLEKAKRLEWVKEEMTTLTDLATYRIDPDESWRRLKLSGLKPKQLAVLRALCKWRELEAQAKDLPRARVLRDETLAELAAVIPHTLDDVRHVRGTGGLKPSQQEKLLVLVQEAINSPPDTWPQLSPRPAASTAGADAVALLQMLLALQCRRHNILPRLVASRDDLEAIAEGRDSRLLHDWRYEIFGQHAVKMLKGELGFRFDAAKKQVIVD